MALKCEKIYVFKKPTKQIMTSLENVKFRLTWGGEYLDFRFNESKNYILPETGSTSLLNKMTIRPYTIKLFIDLSKKASEFMVFGGKELQSADSVIIRWYIDYHRMIADLEEKGKIITGKSTNVLSISSLRFLFTDPENKKIFGSTFYEFDSLGTTMFTELSAAIEKLWVKDASKKN